MCDCMNVTSTVNFRVEGRLTIIIILDINFPLTQSTTTTSPLLGPFPFQCCDGRVLSQRQTAPGPGDQRLHWQVDVARKTG